MTQPDTPLKDANMSFTHSVPLQSTRPQALAGALLCCLCLAGPAQAVIPPAERQVLLNLYSSTNGADWMTRTNWNGAAGTECTWYGITCDAGQTHVLRVNLADNNLTGTLPAISDLTAMQYFDVGDNQIGGSLPSLTGLSQLDVFQGRTNRFTGPIPSLAGLTNLSLFEVKENQLSGPIPSLAGLTTLQYFFVSSNRLTGNIPPLTGLSSLVQFYVSYNQLTGPIPSLAGLGNLTTLSVSHNQLTGPIPSLAGLDSLMYFRVEGNRLSGPPPAVPAPTNVLVPGLSRLCPNPLELTADPAWDTATGSTPWYRGCDANQPIPALSPLALGALAGALGLGGMGVIRRRSAKRGSAATNQRP